MLVIQLIGFQWWLSWKSGSNPGISSKDRFLKDHQEPNVLFRIVAVHPLSKLRTTFEVHHAAKKHVATTRKKKSYWAKALLIISLTNVEMPECNDSVHFISKNSKHSEPHIIIGHEIRWMWPKQLYFHSYQSNALFLSLSLFIWV